MLAPVWQRLDHVLRVTLPFATAFVCCLLGVAAWPLPYFGPVAPPLALMAVYYWTIHRPDLFGSAAAFAIGLLHDLVNDMPPGLSALLFVVAQQLILRQRRFFADHSFLMLWAGFALTVIVVTVIEWILTDMIRWQNMPVLPLAMQTALALVFFPLPCWLFIRLQRAALPPS